MSSKSTRAAARARISQLDMWINTLQKMLKPLLAERAAAQEVLDSYKYPVLTMPNEILSEIFLNFLPYPARPLLVGPLSPSFLCRICRRWRDIALSTPVLWSTMQLELDEPTLYPQQLRILEAWLQRSGSCPLSISLEREEDYSEISASVFVDAVFRHSARWLDMEFILPSRDLRFVEGDMPLLQDLRFGPSPEDADEALLLAAPIVAFQHAPSLRDVELSVAFNPFAIHLPWASITTLVAYLYAEETVEILRHSQALVDCEITLYPSLGPADLTIIPPLQHLASLTLKEPICYLGDGTRNIINLLNALTLPALRRFEIEEVVLCSPSDPGTTLPSLVSFISRIRRLKVLRIMDSSYPLAFYQEHLSGVPVANIYVTPSDRLPSQLTL
ncbi:hypothetical protein B0H13DRAFT_1722370 [Mycena leptocephala]|nr:hypothetical protein B0H13DRAFT_1722370 [Mycena leptocephala]